MDTKIKYFSKAALIFALFVFAGCTAQKEAEVPQKKALPSWYVNPPQTTTSTLYALGEGENRDEAVKNALNMMASTLSVSISSQYDSKKVVQDGLINTDQSTVISTTQSDVRKIRISSYELMESHSLGFRKHVVLIRSNKQKLFDSLKGELEQRFALVESQLASLSLHHSLAQLKGYKKAKEEIGDVPNTLVVMNVLDSSYKGEEYIQKIDKINLSYEELLSKITLEINCDSNSKNLEAPIRDGFGSKGVLIQAGSGSSHFRVNVRSSIQKASSYGFTIARFAIDISVKDSKDSIVASNKLNIAGQSTQGYEVAKESAAIKLGEMIKKEGIYKVTGLDI